MDPYDQFHYESIAFPDTSPGHLATVGRLFGMAPAPPGEARVLELGCASGGNLIPMACGSPRSRYTGIDLSASQVREGQALIDELGLENVSLRADDILDLKPGLGEFDYIIAHGVYSWVPQPVRERILSLARELLAPSGLFYLSFNALPGWRMRGMLRDILRDAVRNESGPQARVTAARHALDRLERGVAGLDTLSARYLREEIRHLRESPPSYLLFEYLAEENRAFLFREFADDVRRHGLQYLCDTELAYGFPASLGDEAEQALSGLESPDDVEQWMDFIGNRNFRRAVLARDDARHTDEPSLDVFADLSFACDLTPPAKLDLRREKPAPFSGAGDDRVMVSHPLTKAMVVEMSAHHPACLPLPEWLAGAQARLHAAGADRYENDTGPCLTELFTLYARRQLIARPERHDTRRREPGPPRASALARTLAATGSGHVVTAFHATLDLDNLARRMILLLDGSRSAEQIAGELLEEVRSGRLPPPAGINVEKWTEDKLRRRMQAACRDLLARLARYGILE